MTAILLSLLDYVVIQIEIGNLAQSAALYGSFSLFTKLFPAPSTLMPSILWFALLVLRLKAPGKGQVTIYRYEYFFALLFSCVLLAGHSLQLSNSLVILTANKPSFCLTLVSLCGLTLLSVNMLRWMKYVCLQIPKCQIAFPKLWNRHPFLFPFVVIFLLWLPFAIAKYPGGIDFDSYYQILEPMGLQPLSNHWPISSSYFFAGCVLLGKFLFGSNNAGLFLAVLCQMLLCASCLAYAVKTLHKMNLNHLLLILVLAVFSLTTIFSRYTTSISKDSLFASAVVLYISIFTELLMDKPRLKKLIAFAGASVAVGVLRSNGVYVIGISTIVLALACLICRDKSRLKILSALACGLLICIAYLNLLIPALGIPSASFSEALSLPFMQTARYVTYYPEDVTDEEKQIIDSVLDFDILPSIYNEKLSDFVKGTYHGDTHSLIKYFGVWFKQFLRHPDVYLLATANNVYGYFYPGAQEDTMGIYMQYDPVSDAPIQLFSLPEGRANERADRLDKLTNYIMAFENFPLFYPLCNVAVHFWLSIYLFFSVIAHKKSSFIHILLPSITSILVCIAGPTFFHNGLRYGLPVIFASPFLFSIYLHSMDKKSPVA